MTNQPRYAVLCVIFAGSEIDRAFPIGPDFDTDDIAAAAELKSGHEQTAFIDFDAVRIWDRGLDRWVTRGDVRRAGVVRG